MQVKERKKQEEAAKEEQNAYGEAASLQWVCVREGPLMTVDKSGNSLNHVLH